MGQMNSMLDEATSPYTTYSKSKQMT